MKTVQDALDRKDLSLIINFAKIQQIAVLLNLQIASNRSLFVKLENNQYTEVYEFTGSYPTSEREIRKLL